MLRRLHSLARLSSRRRATPVGPTLVTGCAWGVSTRCGCVEAQRVGRVQMRSAPVPSPALALPPLSPGRSAGASRALSAHRVLPLPCDVRLLFLRQTPVVSHPLEPWGAVGRLGVSAGGHGSRRRGRHLTGSTGSPHRCDCPHPLLWVVLSSTKRWKKYCSVSTSSSSRVSKARNVTLREVDFIRRSQGL